VNCTWAKMGKRWERHYEENLYVGRFTVEIERVRAEFGGERGFGGVTKIHRSIFPDRFFHSGVFPRLRLQLRNCRGCLGLSIQKSSNGSANSPKHLLADICGKKTPTTMGPTRARKKFFLWTISEHGVEKMKLRFIELTFCSYHGTVLESPSLKKGCSASLCNTAA